MRCNCQIPLQGRRFHYPMLLLRSLTFNSLYSARQIPRLCALLSDSQLCLSDSSGWEKPLLPRSSLSQAMLSRRAQFTGDLWSVTNLGHFWTRLSCHIGRFSLHKKLDGGMCCNRLLNILKKKNGLLLKHNAEPQSSQLLDLDGECIHGCQHK